MKYSNYGRGWSSATVEFPVEYYFGLEDLQNWANRCDCSREELINATEQSLRFRRHEAVVEPRNRRDQYQPDVFTLLLGVGNGVAVFYTIESHAVVVRGFGWEIVGAPLDDHDGGFFYLDNKWVVMAREKQHKQADSPSTG